MNRSITSNELFHFTKFENLLGIIADGFYPRYKIEYTFLSNIFPERPSAFCAFPMVCFCDIPTYLAQEHSNKYGKCAIGLKKNWGYTQGLNPVIYVSPNSKLGDAHSALANSFNGYHSSKVPNLEVVNMITQALKSTNHIACFLKQYERFADEEIFMNNTKLVFPAGRFYDEREWRYVPYDDWGNIIMINAVDVLDSEKMEVHHKNVKRYKLNFSIEDITHLIFEKEEEEQKLINAMMLKFNTTEERIRDKIDIKLLVD